MLIFTYIDQILNDSIKVLDFNWEYRSGLDKKKVSNIWDNLGIV